MFTGLVKEIGTVKKVSKTNEGIRLTISCKDLLPEISVDDSVAINGVCQTAVKVDGSSFDVDTVFASLEKTTLKNLKVSDEVNLELALRLSDRLGGHIVSGHVNGTYPIVSISNRGENFLVSIKLDSSLMKYVVREGSICIDGTSLTIAYLDDENMTVTVSIIPHTFHATILKNKKVGDLVNIEVDALAKYTERLLKFSDQKKSAITEDWLRSKGF